ncbi:MAG TPA: DUF4942 domain-containing protein [Pyrinomonadaceae bacterium]|jgi:hypothetical protein
MTAKFIEDLYPTPRAVIIKMLAGIKLNEVDNVLDLGAGRGDISQYIAESWKHGYSYRSRGGIDVVEINPDLQAMLRGKGLRLVHDDILTFSTQKVYDLIIANFPFSIGAECLQVALNLLERNGGHLRCLVNAITIRRPATRLAERVKNRLLELGAEIEYLPEEFTSAERPTKVEGAFIKLHVEKPEAPSILLDSLKKAEAVEVEEEGAAHLVEANFKAELIARFNVECSLGVNLINEYFALKPHMTNRIKRQGEENHSDYTSQLIKLEVEGADKWGIKSQGEYVNAYLSGLRYKYWASLLRDPRFSRLFTSNILTELDSKLDELKDYDFTPFNIQALYEELTAKIVEGIEASILSLFDKCTQKYAWDESIHNKNVHYFNGWRTNKAHKINKKVILPVNGICAYLNRLESRVVDDLRDMVKVFNYLSDDRADVRLLVGNAVEYADRTRDFTDIDLRYFTVTYYKKGTCHIRFKDQRLLDKLNIYAARKRGWLPPAYGKTAYEDLRTEEREVVDSFQGREAYEEVVREAKFYIVEAGGLLQLAGGQEQAAEVRAEETRALPAPAPEPVTAAAPAPAPEPKPLRPFDGRRATQQGFSFEDEGEAVAA